MTGLSVPATPARWLSPPPAPPDQPLHEASGEFATLMLAWLRGAEETAKLEWVVDAQPGGGLRSWLRCHEAIESEISLLAEAAGEELAVAEPPRGPGGVGRPLGVQLGGPVAWRMVRIQPGDAIRRVRWLAERGLGLQLHLRMWPLTPLRTSREKVERQRALLATGEREWQHLHAAAEHAERVLRGVLFELSLESIRPLSGAERALLTRAFQTAFTPAAQLAERSAPALAEEGLAEALLREFGSTRPDTQQELESAAETQRLIRTLYR